jgi:hypothetical protein
LLLVVLAKKQNLRTRSLARSLGQLAGRYLITHDSRSVTNLRVNHPQTSPHHAIFYTKAAWFLMVLRDSFCDMIQRFLHLINQDQAKMSGLNAG